MKRDLNQFQSKEYDSIIIGGGIYGAAICWEAASRGLKAALFEKSDFGSATSANSLKIIHGGFRYLQDFDLNRVKESIKEQKALMYIAPHLVHLLPVLIPTYGHGLRGKEAFSTGLRLFNYLRSAEDQLSDPEKHIPPGRFISKNDCVDLLPLINRNGLNGAAQFFDAQVYNSERLIISFLHSAANSSAHIANYTEVVDFLIKDHQVKGVKVRDGLTGKVFEARSSTIVLACGPWNEQLLALMDGSTANQTQHYAKAVNLVTHRLVEKYAVGILGKNQHLNGKQLSNANHSYLFIAPWRDYSIIGTAYSMTGANPNDVQVSETDITFLLKEVNRIYPEANLSRNDVLFAHGGLIPVTKKSANDQTITLTKSYEIIDHSDHGYDGLVSIEGVKYTTARDVAQKTIDYLWRRWDYEFVPSVSSRIRLYGGEITRFGDFLLEAERQNRNKLSEDQLRSLVFNFGSVLPEVLKCMDDSEFIDNDGDKNLRFLGGQIRYSIKNEMAKRLGDVVFRRTELGSAGHPGDEPLEFSAQIMGRELQWSQSRIDEELAAVQKAFSRYHFESHEQQRERVGDQALQ